MIHPFKYFLLCLIVFLFACENPQPKEESWETIVQTEDIGDFRGVQIGDDIKTVLAHEQQNIVHTMPDELTCRIPLNLKDSTFYEITYNFNKKGLYVIDLVLFPKDSSSTMQLFEDFKEFYDYKFGTSTAVEKYTTWYTQSSDGTDVEITMIDESHEKGRPFLSITYYEEEGIAP